MAMNPNVTMANMNPMGGPVGGAPVPMMNNGAVNPQAAAAAARQQQANDNQRGVLNTYIYEYFIRYGMYDCARSLLSSDQQVNVHKDGAGRRRDENGNVVNGVGDDPMDTDSKDDLDGKLPDDLPPPKLPMTSDTSFLYEWFCLFWDVYNAQRAKGGNGTVNQYVSHTQQQSRMKQSQQQELLRQMRPDMSQQQYQAQLMRQMQNNGMAQMGMGGKNLARTAMANNQNNPQVQMLQQAKQNPMQRDPSGMDANRERPSSPASGENAPSPSKRPRIDGAVQFNPNQPGAVMQNGRPAQGMPGQPINTANAAAASQLMSHGINPNSLTAQQFQNFVNMPPAAQQKSIQTYSANLQQQQGMQMGNKQMPNAAGPHSQGSPMMPPGPDGGLAAFYPQGEMGPGAMRAGPAGAQVQSGSNHALQDYQMQLMLLEQQNKKRLMMARQEQDNMGSMPRDPNAPGAPGAPGAPSGPNGQPFPDASPQAMRTGTSPNPTDQMKRGTPQMNNSGIPSPVPEGGQSRGSPNNSALNFMGNQGDPNMAPHFYNKGMDGSMAAVQAMNGMRGPGPHPGQPFNGMNPQMMAARQQQQMPGQQQPGGPGNPQQWQQQAPNGQMMPQGMQQNQQLQGTPQQRSAMPPPSAPAAAGTNANARTTASPQQAAAAPPTPNQGNKAAPKKKDTKNAKDKRAGAKKSNSSLNNAGATPAGDNGGEAEATPATPITPVNPTTFKAGQNGPNGQPGVSTAGAGGAQPPTGATNVPVPQPPNAQVPAPSHGDPNQNSMAMDSFGMVDGFGMELANPLTTNDVLNDFDFDSFLHDDNSGEHFDFNNTFPPMEGSEIGAD